MSQYLSAVRYRTQRQAVAREPAASDAGSGQLDAGVGGADAVVAARQRTLKHQAGVSSSRRHHSLTPSCDHRNDLILQDCAGSPTNKLHVIFVFILASCMWVCV